MHYQFESKIAVETLQEKSILQKLCLVGGILAVICSLATIFIDGLDGLSFLTGIFVPFFLLLMAFRKRSKIDYVPTTVILILSERKILINYPSIRRYMNSSSISEEFEFSTDDIQSLQYSAELNAIRLYGTPVTVIAGRKDESRDKLREKVVYLPVDKSEMICADIEKYLGIPLDRME